MKRCIKCGVEQPLGNFCRAATTRDGLRGDCKTCNLAAKKRYYQANAPKIIAKVKEWQHANAERVNAVQRARRADPAVKRQMRAYHLKRTFGLTLEQYDEIFRSQNGGCGVCRRSPRADIALR